MSRGVNLPGSSIIVFDMPDKIIITGKEDELCAKKLKVVTEALNEFLKEDDKVVCFLPDDLNLLFFYKGTTDAIDISLASTNNETELVDEYTPEVNEDDDEQLE